MTKKCSICGESATVMALQEEKEILQQKLNDTQTYCNDVVFLSISRAKEVDSLKESLGSIQEKLNDQVGINILNLKSLQEREERITRLEEEIIGLKYALKEMEHDRASSNQAFGDLRKRLHALEKEKF